MEDVDKPDRDTFRFLMRLRPFGDFDGLTPDEAYGYIFDALDPVASPIIFNEDVEPDVIERVPFFRDVAGFLGLVRAEEPLKLTQKGNLPLAFCKKIVDLGLAGPDDRWLKEHGFRSELDCHDLHLVNILCRMAGLTRKTHGKVSLTRRGERCLGVENSLDLCKRLFFTYVGRFNWGFEDWYEEATSIQAGFAFSMYLVKKYGDSANEVEFYADKFAAAFPFVIRSFSGRRMRTPEEEFLLCYSLRTFERFLLRFGLVDVTREKDEERDRRWITKSDLFDKIIGVRQGLPQGGARAKSGKGKRRFKQVYQFKITLKDTKPPVWRRIRVPETYTFWDLHVAIQDAMGWSDYHLHGFVLRDPQTGAEVFIGIPDDEFPSLRVTLAGWRQKISDWFSGDRKTARYEYDFGDGWEHEIRLEKVLPREEGVEYPVCLDGKMACPPEDVGGTGGYERFLRILADPSHEEHESMLEWAGGGFNPTDFDPAAVEFDNPKERLKRLQDPW
jgi:hypothetical protein